MSASTVVDTSYPALRKLWDVREQVTQTTEEAREFDAILISVMSSRLPKAEWQAVLELAALHYRETKRAVVSGH